MLCDYKYLFKKKFKLILKFNHEPRLYGFLKIELYKENKKILDKSSYFSNNLFMHSISNLFPICSC
jgi:hypothetical protein